MTRADAPVVHIAGEDGAGVPFVVGAVDVAHVARKVGEPPNARFLVRGGENSCEMRETVCTGLEFMGVEFDRAANKGARGVDKILSKPSSRVKVAVIATDEELVIATDTYNLVK